MAENNDSLGRMYHRKAFSFSDLERAASAACNDVMKTSKNDEKLAGVMWSFYKTTLDHLIGIAQENENMAMEKKV